MDALHVDLSEHLSVDERIIRRLLCSRLWRDGLCGLRNLDLERFRSEYHAGLQARRRIRRLLSDRPVDVVHFHRQATAYGSLRLMARLPSIVSIDATQDIVIDAAGSPLERLSYLPNTFMDGKVFRAARAIVSTSRWAADCLRRRYPDCEAPIHVMPPPVLLHRFDPAWVEERFARATSHGYLPRVLFIGGDFGRKGGLDLVQAWSEGRLHEVAELDLVTDSPLVPPGIPGVRVWRSVAVYSEEWIALWRTADVFVLPSRQEAFGNVLQEAAAAGLPRIATRIHAIPESIHDGDDGLLVPVGDRPAIVNALRQLIGSRHLRRRFGCAGQRMAERLSPDRYVAQLHTIIGSLSARAA
jgi:glycosyltransferase involved in cell wall biosynthesis